MCYVLFSVFEYLYKFCIYWFKIEIFDVLLALFDTLYVCVYENFEI